MRVCTLGTQSDKVKKKILGRLFLQILVDTEGHSCLLSVENKTNIETSKLHLKEKIDKEIVWEKPPKKLSVSIMLDIEHNKVHFTRLGLNGNTGWHEIVE